MGHLLVVQVLSGLGLLIKVIVAGGAYTKPKKGRVLGHIDRGYVRSRGGDLRGSLIGAD